ncbi:MAG: DciA family protein, partial [Pseudomonadota bacterium]
ERVKWPKVDEDDREGADGEASSSRRGRSAARDARQSHVAGTLVLRVDGPLALELQHRSAQLIERINRYFGYRAIAALRILQAPLEDIRVQHSRTQRHGRGSSEAAGQRRGARQGVPAPRQDLTSVGDPRLRDALERLSRRVAPARDAAPH